MSRINRAALAAFFVACVGGCAVQERYAPAPVVCPPMPSLPLVMESELSFVSDDVYRRLVERELRLKAYIGQLRAVCDGE